MRAEQSYWTPTMTSRISRRRLLRLAGAAGSGAIAMAMLDCGGSDNKPAKETSLITKPVDSGTRAVKGTTLPFLINNDFTQWNIEGNGDAATQANHGYSRLVKFKPLKWPEGRSAVVEGDAATSWEISPDGLNYTFHIRPNMRFDQRPPTSGRPLTSADVKFSWDRFAQISPYGPDLAASQDKTAPILRLEAPDSSTVVIKLQYPFAGLLPELAFYRHMVVLPVEADDKFSTKTDVRGTGPWIVKDYRRSASVTYSANPDYYEAAKVLPAAIEYPIIPEYATRLAQFRAGRVATSDVNPEDILSTKRDLPQLQMHAADAFSQGGQSIRFGFNPDSPFRDVRLRQAISMLIDRDLFIDTFRNTKEFTDAGLDVPRRWHTCIPCGYDDFWLDPKDKKNFGENAKYYQYDPATAKQLVQASGRAPVQTDFVWTNNQYGPVFGRMAQVLQQMWEVGGDFKFTVKNPDYTTEWRNSYDRNYGRYRGVSLGQAGTGTPDVNGQITARLHAGDNQRTGHVDENGNLDQKLEDMIAAQRMELDVKKRAAIIYDMQRYVAKTQYYMMDAGDALGFLLAWPWLGNWGAYRNWTGGVDSNEIYPYLWVDESKRK